MLRGVRARDPVVASSPRRRTRWGAVPRGVLRCSALGWCLAASAACDRRGEANAFPPPDPDLAAANAALGDPYGGRYPLDEALAGLPPGERLIAELVTSEGTVRCTLLPEHAPLTVASFVGLARGRRPVRTGDGTWQAISFYAQIPWHRAEAGQFVQTGRHGRLAQGGFFLQDEIGVGDSFDRPGVLAMANTGAEHSASTQFFVTTGPAPQLQGAHTIFGQCDGEATLRRIERRIERPADPPAPPMLVRIDVSRG